MKKEYNPEFDFSIEFKLKPRANSNYLPTKDPEIKDLATRYGATFYRSYPGFQTPELLLLYTLSVAGNTVKMDKKMIINAFLATGKFEDDVKEFEPVELLSCTNPVAVNDPHFLDIHGWALRMIEAPSAWALTRGNPNVLIGIADTDFRTTHEDLRNKLQSVTGPFSGQNPHGTRVTSIAGAETNNGRGMASIGFNARIAARRVIHSPGGGSEPSYIRSAILDLHNRGVRIINASWAATGLDPVAARDMTMRGTVLVLAGGNSPGNEFHTDIADIPGVIVVSGVDRNNRHGPTLTARNRWIDICAPSMELLVADGGSDNDYRIDDHRGWTSFAAPFVAGTIALMRSVNSALTPAQIEQMLKITADPIADGAQFLGLLGAGRLNAYRAVRLAMLQITGVNVVPCSGTVTYTLSQNFVGDWSVQTGLTIIGASQGVRSITVSRTPNIAVDSAFISVNIRGTSASNSNFFYTIRRRMYIGVDAVTRIIGPTNMRPWEMGWYQAVPHNLSGGGNFAWSVTPSPFQMHIFQGTAHIEFGQEGSYTIMCRATSPCNQQFDPATLYVFVSHFFASSVHHHLASGTLHIEINPVTKEDAQEVLDFIYDIHLYDDKVNMMKQKITKENKTTFDVADLPGGNYFLHIYDGVNEHPIVQLITIEEKADFLGIKNAK